MKKEYYNLRVITNLNCDENCCFCYQRNKKNIRLSKEFLADCLRREGKFYPRAAIYGGEATLLGDLNEYMEIIRGFCRTLSLTTNGNNLDRDKLLLYKNAGLDEIGISVPSIKHWRKIRKSSFEKVINNAELALKIFGRGARINIVENVYNMSGACEIYEMIDYFTRQLGVGVLVCRNFLNKFPKLDLRKIGFRAFGGIKNGVRRYVMADGGAGPVCSYYEPLRTYDRNDLVISPVGNFYQWTHFLKAVSKN